MALISRERAADSQLPPAIDTCAPSGPRSFVQSPASTMISASMLGAGGVAALRVDGVFAATIGVAIVCFAAVFFAGINVGAEGVTAVCLKTNRARTLFPLRPQPLERHRHDVE